MSEAFLGSPAGKGNVQRLSLSINTPPGKCRYHFSDMPIAREKQICTRDSTFLSEVPTSNFILHTYMLIQQVLLSLVLRKCFQLPFLEGLLCPGEDVLLHPS